MENRRLFLFLLSTMTFLWLWSNFLAPPPEPQDGEGDSVADVAETQPGQAAADQAGGELTAATAAPAVATEAGAPAAGQTLAAAADSPAAPTLKFPEYEAATQLLGSLQADSGYGLQVQLSSIGASVDAVWLTSPQFRDLQNPGQQVQLIGNNLSDDRTFTLALTEIDALLKERGVTLEQVHWKLAETSEDKIGGRAVFQYDSPDGRLRLRKIYTLPRSELAGAVLQKALRETSELYTLSLTLEVVNLTEAAQVVSYELQGPVGMLLENKEHTYKYQDIHLEFPGGKPVTLNIGTLQNYCNDIDQQLGERASLAELTGKLREDYEWTEPPRYAGVDVQFFSAMVAPLPRVPVDTTDPDDAPPELRADWLDRTYPMLIGPDLREMPEPFFVSRLVKGFVQAVVGRPVDPRTAELSFRFASVPVAVPAGQTVSHAYAFFVGPKRRELLDPSPFEAGQVLNYGWFGPVARVMHYLLDFFYSLGLPYVLCIISLTILVRGCIFPISKKQAIMAARQKELQPELAALRQKYGDDQQKFARAQMELWRKHNINPLSGCLPVFLQLPILVGLYTALNSAVDLRGQHFLWISNLAAPDALFRLPFPLPFGMGFDFSILPLCTVGLFLVQQKMFMPPATTDQEVMQQKMMNFMTLFMGIFFWHQPAGLSVYFIASSLWGITERKLLGTGRPVPAAAAAGVSGVQVIDPNAGAVADRDRRGSQASETASGAAKPAGFWQKLMDAAEEAQRQAESKKNREGKKDRKT